MAGVKPLEIVGRCVQISVESFSVCEEIEPRLDREIRKRES